VLPWLAAWQIRNKIETGYSGFSSVSEVNFYFLTSADLIAQSEHRQMVDVSKELGGFDPRDSGEQTYLYQSYLSRHPEQVGWSQGQRLSFMHSWAAGVIRSHFSIYLRSCTLAFLKTVFNPGEGNFNRLLHPADSRNQAGAAVAWPVHRAILLASADPRIAVQKLAFEVVLLGLYLFAVRGIIFLARGVFRDGIQNTCLWLLLGTSLYFLAVTAVAGGTGADARYRLPIMPVICILAAAGFWHTKAISQKAAKAPGSSALSE
jgi:thiosulfate reductase cytochrome b subunit